MERERERSIQYGGSRVWGNSEPQSTFSYSPLVQRLAQVRNFILFFKKKKVLNTMDSIGSFQNESCLYGYISLEVIKVYLKYLLKEK